MAVYTIGDDGTPEAAVYPPPVDWPVVPEPKRRADALVSSNPKDRIGVLKPRLDLVPSALDIQVAEAMANGAQKYGPFNWREHPVKASVYIAAARRHLAQWFDGEDRAPDSGVHHLAHAAACLAIVLDAEASGTLLDDRHLGPASQLIEALTHEDPAA